MGKKKKQGPVLQTSFYLKWLYFPDIFVLMYFVLQPLNTHFQWCKESCKDQKGGT